jgi:hypothetical protein
MELSEKLAIKRHEELRGDLRAVAKAISESSKDDPELKGLLRENSQAINKFVEAVSAIKPVQNSDLKIEVDNGELINRFGEFVAKIGQIMIGIDSRLQALENKPLPKKLEAKRNKFSGEIEYITIEYNKL